MPVFDERGERLLEQYLHTVLIEPDKFNDFLGEKPPESALVAMVDRLSNFLTPDWVDADFNIKGIHPEQAAKSINYVLGEIEYPYSSRIVKSLTSLIRHPEKGGAFASIILSQHNLPPGEPEFCCSSFGYGMSIARGNCNPSLIQLLAEGAIRDFEDPGVRRLAILFFDRNHVDPEEYGPRLLPYLHKPETSAAVSQIFHNWRLDNPKLSQQKGPLADIAYAFQNTLTYLT